VGLYTEKYFATFWIYKSAGAGKLIGPDGQEMDNEAFLSDLKV
jgi:hypothetical protein